MDFVSASETESGDLLSSRPVEAYNSAKHKQPCKIMVMAINLE